MSIWLWIKYCKLIQTAGGIVVERGEKSDVM
jgi:hypothetical protein